LPRVARIAYIVAFVIAALEAIGAATVEIINLPLALIPLIAGIGIMRGRAWSAYGFALVCFAQLLAIPVALSRSGGVGRLSLAAAIFFPVGLLFFFAGRALAAGNGARGRAFPWIVLSILSFLPIVFVGPYSMPTGSMEDTLLVGDYILVRCFPTPNLVRGDMVVFRYPIDRRQTFVKRVIGLPGDRIRLSHKVLYRNGEVLNEPYAVHKLDYVETYRDDFPAGEPYPGLAAAAVEMLSKNIVNGELVVPAGKYFVLGDNRDQSLDSRYWGFITPDDLIGKPLLIYDSEDRTTEELSGGTRMLPKRIRWERFFKLL
jgi:signal peptidase I